MMYMTINDYEKRLRDAKKCSDDFEKEVTQCFAAFFKPVKTTQEQKKAVVDLRLGNHFR